MCIYAQATDALTLTLALDSGHYFSLVKTPLHYKSISVNFNQFDYCVI